MRVGSASRLRVCYYYDTRPAGGRTSAPCNELPHNVVVVIPALDLLGGVRLAAHLDVGVDEIIQRWAVLLRHEVDVAADREGHAVFRQVTEAIVLEFRV